MVCVSKKNRLEAGQRSVEARALHFVRILSRKSRVQKVILSNRAYLTTRSTPLHKTGTGINEAVSLGIFAREPALASSQRRRAVAEKTNEYSLDGRLPTFPAPAPTRVAERMAQ